MYLVTTTWFLSSVAAIRTFDYISCYHVFLEIIVSILTRYTRMFHTTTVKAHQPSAFTLSCSTITATTSLLLRLLHIVNTPLGWTPLEVFISFNINILLKLNKFLIDNCTSKFLHISFCELFPACMIHTLYFKHETIGHLYFQVVRHTVSAVCMVWARV